VWRDREGAVNADNYAGVAGVSSPQEWFDFAREAAANPQPFIEAQRRFLAAQQMPLEPRDVFARFAAIFQAARRLDVPQSSRLVPRDRFLFVANAHLPTLRVCLERPLTPLVRSGDLKTALVTEPHLRERQTAAGDADGIGKWIDERFSRFAPSALIFSRYSGPHARTMVDWARHNRVPVIYQIDDDLLSVPRSLGERKFAYHNAPERLEAVRTLLESADVVYASTERLRQRLLGYDPELPVITGPINCSGRVIRRPSPGPARIIGYMASADHLPNLTMVLPAITKLLDRHPQISFEFFGSIPIPQELERFGSRVTKAPAVTDYEHFLHRLAGRAWDIGICPLTPTEFNLTKSNNKWIEYTSVGIATVASANMIYDECCGDGCGILAWTEEQWLAGLERLVTDDAARVAIVERAQRKLESVYSIDRHRQQIIDIVALARQRADARGTRIEEAA